MKMTNEKGTGMKLHLGCGQVYLDGYVNIDFPLSEHTVQEKSVADEYHDLTTLRYEAKSVDEVRLHHVYEHFPRHQALALLAAWHTWLKRGGRIHIEVPDFDVSAKLVVDPKQPDRDRKVALRHIFGSNEAGWATHYEGWSAGRLTEAAKLIGFKDIEIKQESYLATRNVIITARKKSLGELDARKARALAKKYLTNFTLNDSEFETSLLEIWLGEFDEQFKKCAAR
jgi:predicted SAM-dependent methyltransferase